MNWTKTGNRNESSYDVLGIQHVAPDSRRLSACEHFPLRSFAATVMRLSQIERHFQQKLLTLHCDASCRLSANYHKPCESASSGGRAGSSLENPENLRASAQHLKLLVS